MGSLLFSEESVDAYRLIDRACLSFEQQVNSCQLAIGAVPELSSVPRSLTRTRDIIYREKERAFRALHQLFDNN